MPTIEIRRHSIRKTGGGSQLSQAGVDLARKLGESMGPFTTVATSVVPRARETALAMGFAVDHELLPLNAGDGVYRASEESEWWLAEHPFAAFAKVIESEPDFYRYAHAIASLWRDLLTPLEEDDSVLVIGHSGELEAGLIACLADADHKAWGNTFGPCEGARLHYQVNRYRSVEILRVP